jgi:hypothetical protein
VPISNQRELNKAIELVDRASHMRSLRLLLSKHHDSSSIGDDITTVDPCRSPSPSTVNSGARSLSVGDGRFSPPPGSERRRGNALRTGVGGSSYLGSLDEEAIEIPYASSASSRPSSLRSTDSCLQ